jgi:transcription elongation GreA/GreB family factor
MEYMSQEGYDKLVAELHQLESVDLPQVRDAIAEARDKGDLSEGKISIKSPIAQALLNKKVGDVVEVQVPISVQKLRIESITL